MKRQCWIVAVVALTLIAEFPRGVCGHTPRPAPPARVTFQTGRPAGPYLKDGPRLALEAMGENEPLLAHSEGAGYRFMMAFGREKGENLLLPVFGGAEFVILTPLDFSTGFGSALKDKDIVYIGIVFSSHGSIPIGGAGDLHVESSDTYPLTIKLLEDGRCAYVCGRGTVKTKSGETHRLGYDDTIETWLPRLRSTNQLDREGAAQALGWLAKEAAERDKAIHALLQALDDRAMAVRRNACESLGRIGDVRAVDALSKLADAEREKEEWVRDAAEESLGLIQVKSTQVRLAKGDAGALREMSRALKHKWTLVRRIATQALANAGPAAVGALITALGNEDSEVRIQASRALAQIGDKRATPSLKEAMAKEKESKVKAAMDEAVKKLEGL